MANFTPSISHSIARLMVFLTLTISVMYSLLILLYSWLIEDNIFNRLVSFEAQYIVEQHKRNGVISPPRNDFMTLHKDWQGLPPYMKQQRLINPTQIEFDTLSGGTVHIEVLSLAGKEYVLAADVGQYEVSRDYLPNVLIWLGLLSLACCVLVVAFAIQRANKITKPLKQLAKEVDSQTQTEISQGYPDNEIGVLAERIELAFGALNESICREANFTKDISHEIRTPVTIIKNVLNQLADSSIPEAEWQQLKQAQRRLEQTTETLLALARNESSEMANTNITEVLENCLMTNWEVNHTEQGQHIEFEINDHADVWQLANRRLIEIMFNNALSNIVHYTAGRQVGIEVSPEQICFTNRHSGRLPQDAFVAGRRSEKSTGIGQGLSLIKRIAAQNSWQASIESTDDMFCLIIQFSSQEHDN